MELLLNILYGTGSFLIDNAPFLVGIILPPFVDYFNKEVYNEAGRFFVTGLICIVVGAVLHWNQILYGTPAEVAASMMLIFTESQAVYRLYFKNSWLREKAQSLYSKQEEGTEPLETMSSTQ